MITKLFLVAFTFINLKNKTDTFEIPIFFFSFRKSWVKSFEKFELAEKLKIIYFSNLKVCKLSFELRIAFKSVLQHPVWTV